MLRMAGAHVYYDYFIGYPARAPSAALRGEQGQLVREAPAAHLYREGRIPLRAMGRMAGVGDDYFPQTHSGHATNFPRMRQTLNPNKPHWIFCGNRDDALTRIPGFYSPYG